MQINKFNDEKSDIAAFYSNFMVQKSNLSFEAIFKKKKTFYYDEKKLKCFSEKGST